MVLVLLVIAAAILLGTWVVITMVNIRMIRSGYDVTWCWKGIQPAMTLSRDIDMVLDHNLYGEWDIDVRRNIYTKTFRLFSDCNVPIPQYK